MSLGSSASFRRIVPFRDTSTMESEIPSFRDAKPHESWELVPLDELSLPGILPLWNRRFPVSGMQSHSNPCWHLVIARRDNAVAIQASGTSLRARPMSLGSSASFRRIVPSRDTSTTESEIPSFRDAKPKQSCLRERIASPFGFAMTVAFK